MYYIISLRHCHQLDAHMYRRIHIQQLTADAQQHPNSFSYRHIHTICIHHGALQLYRPPMYKGKQKRNQMATKKPKIKADKTAFNILKICSVNTLSRPRLHYQHLLPIPAITVRQVLWSCILLSESIRVNILTRVLSC